MKEKIIAFLDDERYEDLQALLDSATKDELTAVLEEMDEEHLAKLFDCLDKELAADVFVLLKPETQKLLLEHFSDIEMQEVTEEILDEKPEELLESLPIDVVQEVLLKADPEQRNDKIVEILNYLEYKKFVQLKPLLAELKPMDIAEIFSEIDEEMLPLIFRLLPKELAAETFVEMNSNQQELLIRSFSDYELKLIIDDLFVDDTVDLIEEMPANVVKRILMQADSETRKSINEILKYPKDSAGSIMTTECISLRQNMTVQQCFEKIRKQAIDKETIYTCYVTDNQKKLLGIVTVKDLLLHSYEEKVEAFMQENFVYVDTHTDKEVVANMLSKYDLLSIPVVDQENLLVGIVTVDDALDVITEEATEDISFINAVTPSDKPYLETGVFKTYLNRLPWLLILMVSATFTGLIINTYEAKLTALSSLLFACVPMLMDTGGNAGSQASVTIIRGIALDEIKFKDLFRVMWKEVRVSVILAASVSVVCFAKLQLIDRLLFGYEYTVLLSLIVSLALFITIVIAKVVGCTLPMLAKRMRLDPAVVASPFITTIVDALSLLVYCHIAISILS